jgi:hypothetical protein
MWQALFGKSFKTIFGIILKSYLSWNFKGLEDSLLLYEPLWLLQYLIKNTTRILFNDVELSAFILPFV